MRGRLKIVLLVLALLLGLGVILAQSSDAATIAAPQGATSLFGLLPTSVALSFIAAYFIPWVSALVSHKDSTWTGIVVLALSFADGFFSDWAANTSHFNWKAALGASLLNWLIAVITHEKIAKGGTVYKSFLALGSTNTTTGTTT